MYSYDVFETLIQRKVYNPEGIFLLMEKDAYVQKYFENDFSEIRKIGESISREKAALHGVEEIEMIDIYKMIAAYWGVEYNYLIPIMELERKLEIENCIPILHQIDELKKRVNGGEEVILISDMYLDTDTIRCMLCKFDRVFQKIPIYVSSNLKLTKASGNLYMQIAEERCIDYNNWYHVGDNRRSDYWVPKLLKINATLIHNSVYDHYLKKIINHYDGSDRLAVQFMFGNIRDQIQNKHDNESLGMILGWLILIPYVNWVLELSRKQKIKKLFFLSRDGYVLKKIADFIIKINGYKIETHYLFSSRKAWRISEERTQEIERLKKYILSEIEIEKDDFAFVDTQGTGTSLCKMLSIINRKNQKVIPCFYYGMATPCTSYNVKYNIFVKNNKRVNIIETLCRAPHGEVLGYMENLEPEFGNYNKKEWIKCGFFEFVRGVEKAVSKINDVYMIDDKIDWSQLSYIALSEILSDNDKSIWNYIGEIPFGEEKDEVHSKFAPELSKKELYEYFVLNKKNIWLDDSILKYTLFRMNNNNREYVNQCLEFVQGKELDGFFWGKEENSALEKKYILPRDCKRIIVYGAGKAGKKFCADFNRRHDIEIVHWFDMDPQNSNEEKVEYLRDGDMVEYDAVIVAVHGFQNYHTIKKILEIRNYDKNKIFYLWDIMVR